MILDEDEKMLKEMKVLYEKIRARNRLLEFQVPIFSTRRLDSPLHSQITGHSLLTLTECLLDIQGREKLSHTLMYTYDFQLIRCICLYVLETFTFMQGRYNCVFEFPFNASFQCICKPATYLCKKNNWFIYKQ